VPECRKTSVVRPTGVSISDAARALVDLIATLDQGGGIDQAADCLTALLMGICLFGENVAR